MEQSGTLPPINTTPPVGTASPETTAPRLYGIGALAAAYGITARAIRFYETKGLLQPRREGLQRFYDYRDFARLGLICRGKRLGFSLAEIRQFLRLYEAEPSQKSQMAYLVQHGRLRIIALEGQRRDIDLTLEEMRRMVEMAEAHLTSSSPGSSSGTKKAKDGP